MKSPVLSIFIGGAVSFAVFVIGGFQFDLIEKFLVFAFFVVVPLALELVQDSNQIGLLKQVYKWLKRLHFPAAIFALASLISSKTLDMQNVLLSGGLSLVWLFFTFLLSLYGLLLILEKGFSHIEELAVGAGLFYFFVGGMWYSLYQFEVNILNFGPTISALTAIHFHYSSSVVPLFTGMLGRTILKKSWYKWVVAVDIIGPVMIAIGISFSRSIEMAGVMLFACNITIYSTYLLFKVRKTITKKAARWFLIISSITVYGTMALAIWYAIGRAFNFYTISIPEMIITHGAMNTFGFVFCGLIGWYLLKPDPKSSIHGIPYSQVFGEIRIGKEFVKQHSLEDKRQEQKGLIDDFYIYERKDFNVSKIDPDIRHFYEQTSYYNLKADIQWKGIFRYLCKAYKPIGRKMGQVNLPVHGVTNYQMQGKIAGILEERDRRESPRAWIRWEEETDEAIFVAIYSYHKKKGVVYNNIALPLLYGNMTGILLPSNDAKDGLVFTSLSERGQKGHEGIYYFSKYIRARLPLNEYFHIYKNDGKLKAKHYMWFFGLPLLDIDYTIER